MTTATATFLESFFDDAQPANYVLWNKSADGIDIEAETVIYKGWLCKYSKTKGKWKQRHFVLTNNYMIYYKAINDPPSKIQGLIKLNMVRTEYLMDGHPTFAEYKYGIRFIKNMKYSDLWMKDEVDLNKWTEALSKVCLQSDFHNKFTALKMIGKGSFARVVAG
jgi:PH domain